MEPFQLTVNNQHEFSLQPEDAAQLDLIPAGENGFHILLDGRAYQAEVVEADYAARQYVLRVNGQKFTVHVADHYERLVQQLGLSVGGAQKQNVVKAPMPGLVINVLVAPDQAVQKGDPLLILEAMKMENVLKAAGEGVVKSVAVKKGMAVEKGAVLVEMG